MFKSIFGLVGDVAKIVVAPVEMVVDVTRIVTKPVADIAEAAAHEVKTVVKDLTE